MKEILADVERWRRAGQQVAIARVVDVKGSGPRRSGATMAVSQSGEVAGSVSGGCVEAAIVDEALAVLATGAPTLCTFGYTEEHSFGVGTTCGGTVRVFVERLDW